MQTSVTTSPEVEAVPSGTMPPYYKATTGQLQTFELPGEVTDNEENRTIGKAMIEAWYVLSPPFLHGTQGAELLRHVLRAGRLFYSRNTS